MIDDPNPNELLSKALVQLLAAIQILDRVGAPGQIAAHIDLGACQLAELLDERPLRTRHTEGRSPLAV